VTKAIFRDTLDVYYAPGIVEIQQEQSLAKYVARQDVTGKQ
jgi:hypothetical protein